MATGDAEVIRALNAVNVALALAQTLRRASKGPTADYLNQMVTELLEAQRVLHIREQRTRRQRAGRALKRVKEAARDSIG